MKLRNQHLVVRLVLVGFFFGFVAHAAQAPAPSGTTLDIGPLIDALVGHKWSLAAAIVVGLVVALAKQGWLSAWLQAKLPPAALPYLAVLLGSLGMVSAAIIGGQPWLPALESGFLAGLLAITGHETVIEGIRKGKELIPARKVVLTPPGASTPPPEQKAA
jgi:hypothetical protein